MLTLEERKWAEQIVKDMSDGFVCCPEFKDRGGCARCTGVHAAACLRFNLAGNLVKKGYRPPIERSF